MYNKYGWIIIKYNKVKPTVTVTKTVPSFILSQERAHKPHFKGFIANFNREIQGKTKMTNMENCTI